MSSGADSRICVLVIGCLISLVGLGYCTDAFGFKKFLAANQPGDGEPKIVGGIGGGSDSAGGPSTWKQFSYQVKNGSGAIPAGASSTRGAVADSDSS